jgi:hypothetical protein
VLRQVAATGGTAGSSGGPEQNIAGKEKGEAQVFCSGNFSASSYPLNLKSSDKYLVSPL